MFLYKVENIKDGNEKILGKNNSRQTASFNDYLLNHTYNY